MLHGDVGCLDSQCSTFVTLCQDVWTIKNYNTSDKHNDTKHSKQFIRYFFVVQQQQHQFCICRLSFYFFQVSPAGKRPVFTLCSLCPPLCLLIFHLLVVDL